MSRKAAASSILVNIAAIAVALTISYHLYIGVYEYGTFNKLTANITVFNSTNTWNCINCDTYPWDLSLAPGTYTIHTESSGYDPDTRGVTIYSRDKSINIYLNRTGPGDKPPQWFDSSVSPFPATYAPNQNYIFSIRWTDDKGVSIVLLEFNGVNYTVSGTGVYSKTISDLAVGDYNYRWFANDTINQWNSTSPGTYHIGRATPQLTLTALPSWSVTVGTETTVSCSANTNQVSLSLQSNGIVVANPDVSTLGIGSYDYDCISTQTQNYSATSVSNTLNVTSGPIFLPDLAVSSIDIVFTPSNPIEGDDVTVDVTIHNLGSVDSGSFQYNLMDLTTGVGGTGTVSNIPANSNVIISRVFQSLSKGVHTFEIDVDTTNIVDESDETNNHAVKDLTVNSVADTTPPSCTGFTTNPTSPTTYAPGSSYTFEATCTDNVAVGEVTLEFNGANYTASLKSGTTNVYYTDLSDLAAGTYAYRWIARDVNNNYASFTRPNYVINKALTNLRLFLNGTESNRNYNAGDFANFTVELENLPGKTVILSTDIPGFVERMGPSPLEVITQLNDRGTFIVTGSFVGDQNYSSSYQSYQIVVNGGDITPPVVIIILPLNTTYTPATFPNGFYWTANEALSWAAYSLDGQPNVTITGNVTPPPVGADAIGTHHLIIFATDLAGNTGYDDIYYTVEIQDTTPPVVTIISPENKTYDINTIDLTFTVNEPTSWTGYSLDGSANITSGNTTLWNLASGSHDLIVYATDLAGNGGKGEVLFAVSCLSHLIDSNVDGVYYFDNKTNIFGISTITCSVINKTNVTVSSIQDSNVFLSKIDNSTIANATVDNCSIKDSIFRDQSCKDSTIDPSDVQRSNTTGSDITDSHVWDSNATYSNITISTLDYCDVTNSTLYNVTCKNSKIYLSNISNSTITNSDIRNSTIENSNIHDSLVEDAVIKDNVLISGCITYNGVKYCAPPSINLNDIYNPAQPPTPSPSGGGCCYGFSPWFTVTAPQSISIQQGESRSFIVTVTNTKPWYIPAISLRIERIPASWFTVEPASQGIDSEKTASYNITITIPENETIGERTLTLLATSGGLEAKVSMVLTITKRSVIITPVLPTGALIFLTNPATVSGIIVVVIAIVLIYLYYFQHEKWDALASFVNSIPDRLKSAYERAKSALKSAYYKLTGKYEIEVIEEYTKPSEVKQAEIEAKEHPDAEESVKFTVEYEDETI